jgi:DNA repair protein RadA/Sms
LKEAAKLGFSIALIPKGNMPKQKIEGMNIIAVERIDQAFTKLRELD